MQDDPPSEPSGRQSAFRASVLRGFAWKAGSQLVVQLTSLIVGLAVARLVAPREYGLAMMVIIFVNALPLLSDLALGNALIARPVLTEDDRSTAFWTSLAIGGLLTGCGILAAGAVADFYNEPPVKRLFSVLVCAFVVTSAGATQHALQLREMNFRAVEIRMMSGTFAGAAVGLASAAAGLGAWALVLQQLTMATVSTVLLWLLSPWRPALRYSLRSLRELLGYSMRVFGGDIFTQLSRNSDSLLIGRFVGAGGVGAYALASSLILMPLNKLATPIQDVLFPAFAQISTDRDRIAAVWLRVNRVMAAIVVPALLGIAALSHELVAVILGHRWAPAVPVLEILCWSALLQTPQRLNPSILKAVDRTGTLLWFSALTFATGIAAVVLGVHWGIVGVAVCYAAGNSVLQPLYFWLTLRAVGASARPFLTSMSGVVEAAAAMFVVVAGGRMLLEGAGAGSALRLAVLVVAGIVVYLLLLVWRAPDLREDVSSLRRGRRLRVGAPVTGS